MSAPIDNGGPAFPHDNQELGHKHRCAQPGMTLRDYFAAKALEGLMSSHIVDDPGGAELLAEDCYKVADAMLAARKENA